jgi:S1-C subfamily serine protease
MVSIEPKAEHIGALYPTVRVRAKSAGGSGTVLWSKEVNGEYVTFVLTNHHVIKSLINVEKKYRPDLKRELPVETRGTAQVEFFQYRDGSRNDRTYSVKADIVAYEEDQDLALLQVRSVQKAEYIAKLAPRGKEVEIQLFDKVYAVGAAMGHPPIATVGHITHMDDEIEDFEYWMTTAQIIFGNSGGAVFLAETLEFIGVPSRVAVANIGWSSSAITHMGYFIPFWRIYDWLEDNYYQFIFDSDVDYEWCEEEREKVQEAKQRWIDIQVAQDLMSS